MNELNVTPPRLIDSSTLETWTDQEIVDYTLSVWAARDFAVARSDKGACLYRGAEAGPCLVGLVLADSCYDKSLEGKTAGTLVRELIPNIASSRLGLLSRLQSLHDSRIQPETKGLLKHLGRDLESFEAQNGVTVPPAVYARLEQLISEAAE